MDILDSFGKPLVKGVLAFQHLAQGRGGVLRGVDNDNDEIAHGRSLVKGRFPGDSTRFRDAT